LFIIIRLENINCINITCNCHTPMISLSSDVDIYEIC
jgi:hypothetical protein